jgi:uncharacterized membrane protein YvbJ
MRCPICGFDDNENAENCRRCGTDFTLFSGDEDELESLVTPVKENSLDGRPNKSNKPQPR